MIRPPLPRILPPDNVYLLGDVHGAEDTIRYWNRDARNSALVQVGDYGIGFGGSWDEEKRKLRSLAGDLEKTGNKLFVIRGNHDDPSRFDGLVFGPTIFLVPDNMMIEACGRKLWCVGGAISVDRAYRRPGVSWWDGEGFGWDGSLPPETPDAIVTHTAGSWTGLGLDTTYLLNFYARDLKLRNDLVRERGQVDAFFSSVRSDGKAPMVWYHGHFHRHMLNESFGTAFLGLAEHEVVMLPPPASCSTTPEAPPQ